MMIEEFCPSHEMQKLETELWNHVMVGAGHATYTDKFHELARLVSHLVTPESRKINRYVYGIAPATTEPKTMQKVVQISGAQTDEAVRNGSIKKVKKRGNMGEPIKDKNGRYDNKMTGTENAFATTVNLIGRENMGVWPKIPLLDGKVLRVLGERLEEKARLLVSAKTRDKKQEEIGVVRDFPEKTSRDYDPMDDEPMWAADRVVAPTLGSAINIPETANKFAIKVPLLQLPILQPGEYDLWKMRMEQYLQCVNYTLWEIIENVNAPIVTKTFNGKETAIPPTSVEEKAQSRAELKERSTLFGGNTATKKTQKNLLKQQYENFAAYSTEMIEQTYERLQKLISELEMHGEVEKPTVETNEPKNARKENEAPIIEDWVSKSEEEDVPKIKIV
ncbi:hypothetical protein Tco_0751460 [Tanacetum coccineum]|uniref:Reverse transcriptase domain-containing protein n=1 Tax=Tanacetum coccineum TaxID=301880 RepID=A0ABQ4Z444_9ASTR